MRWPRDVIQGQRKTNQITRSDNGGKKNKVEPVLTHLTSWFVCGNHLFDETQLGGRDAPDEEDEEQRVVSRAWTGHLMAERDIVIGQCINSR